MAKKGQRHRFKGKFNDCKLYVSQSDIPLGYVKRYFNYTGHTVQNGMKIQ
jgi:hypothetical protein